MKFLHSLISILFMSLSLPSFAFNTNVEELHTIFTNQETRHKLNALRSKQIPTSPIIKDSPQHAHFNFQGILIKGNNPPVIFMNDKISLASKELSLKDYQLKVSVDNKFIYLKPGQKWHGHLSKHPNTSLQYTPEH